MSSTRTTEPNRRRKMLTIGDVASVKKATTSSVNDHTEVNSKTSNVNTLLDLSKSTIEANDKKSHRQSRHANSKQEDEEEEKESTEHRRSKLSEPTLVTKGKALSINDSKSETVQSKTKRPVKGRSYPDSESFLTSKDFDEDSVKDEESIKPNGGKSGLNKTKTIKKSASSSPSPPASKRGGGGGGGGGNRKRESLSKSPKNLTKSDFNLICKNVPDMCVPLTCTSMVSKATWKNFFPAIKKDGTAVYVYKIISDVNSDDKGDNGSALQRKQYKMVDYGPLRMFFTGAWKKFPAKGKPENNYFEYEDKKLGTVKFVYWTALFEAERAKENLSRKLKKQQKSTPVIDINDEEEEEEEVGGKEEKLPSKGGRSTKPMNPSTKKEQPKNLKRKRSISTDAKKKSSTENQRPTKVRVVEIGRVQNPVETISQSGVKKASVVSRKSKESERGRRKDVISESLSLSDSGSESSSSSESQSSSRSSSGSRSSSDSHSLSRSFSINAHKPPQNAKVEYEKNCHPVSESDVEIDLSSFEEEGEEGEEKENKKIVATAAKTTPKRLRKGEKVKEGAKPATVDTKKRSPTIRETTMQGWVSHFLIYERELMTLFLEKGTNSLVFNPTYLDGNISKDSIYTLFSDIADGLVTEESDQRFLIFQTFLIVLHTLNSISQNPITRKTTKKDR